MIRIIICIVLTLSGLSLRAQQAKWKVWHLDFAAQSNIEVRTAIPFDAVTIVYKNEFSSGHIVDGSGHMIPLTWDDEVSFRIQSRLVHFPSPQQKLVISLPYIADSVRVYFQYSPPIKIGRLAQRDDSPCAPPQAIPQSVWRAGLPEPKYQRVQTTTEHIIIHHSDSPNADTDYVALTRAFYLQHTQINGWSDIGYNYLVGFDGTILLGRDPDSSGIAQDEVLGAHFCGKNSATMGVCVIGNFQEEPPTQDAIRSLTRLISWKSYKDQLMPEDSTLHYGEMIPVIAGHRNGCSTLCPGDSLFALIPEIRHHVDSLLTICRQLSTKTSTVTSPEIFPNPCKDDIYVSEDIPLSEATLSLTTLTGLPVSHSLNGQRIIFDRNGAVGIYLIQIKLNGKYFIKKIIRM